MTTPRITDRHERTIVRTFAAHELAALVRKALYEELGQERWNAEPKAVVVRFEDETAGSPAYKVGTKATIEVVIDLNSDRSDP